MEETKTNIEVEDIDSQSQSVYMFKRMLGRLESGVDANLEMLQWKWEQCSKYLANFLEEISPFMDNTQSHYEFFEELLVEGNQCSSFDAEVWDSRCDYMACNANR